MVVPGGRWQCQPSFCPSLLTHMLDSPRGHCPPPLLLTPGFGSELAALAGGAMQRALAEYLGASLEAGPDPGAGPQFLMGSLEAGFHPKVPGTEGAPSVALRLMDSHGDAWREAEG